MIRIKKIFYIFLLIMICFSNTSIATKEEILQNQKETLNIKSFIQEANKYTKEVFKGIDANDLMNDAIKGEIDNKAIISKIINLFGKEVKQTIKIVRKYYYCNSNT